jgi:hypothetical protein
MITLTNRAQDLGSAGQAGGLEAPVPEKAAMGTLKSKYGYCEWTRWPATLPFAPSPSQRRLLRLGRLPLRTTSPPR